MKTALLQTGTIENPLDNADRSDGRWPWITESAGEPLFGTRHAIVQPTVSPARRNRRGARGASSDYLCLRSRPSTSMTHQPYLGRSSPSGRYPRNGLNQMG